jgi:hypothetical protein
MSTAAFEGGFDQLDEAPQLELIIGGAGQVATAEAVEVEEPQVLYRYEVSYGNDGRINGGRSWKYDAETGNSVAANFDVNGRETSRTEYDAAAGESNFIRFDEDGKQINRILRSEPLSMELFYDDKDRLEQSINRFDDGKVRETYWYNADGTPKSSVHIDVAANTHTMTIYQPGIGNWVKTTPYAGPDGWTSFAPAISKK